MIESKGEKMEYITQGQQIKYDEGKVAGLKQGLIALLEAKFGTVQEKHLSQIKNADAETLQKWVIQVLNAPTIDAVFQ